MRSKHFRVPIFGTEERRAQLLAIYEEKLRYWPVPFEPRFVATRYGKTHIIESGDPTKPPLILLHPMGVAGFVWSSIIQSLSERHRVYALDTIGDIGRSELNDIDRYPKNGRDYSEWLDDVYRELGLPEADVAAGSMGGWIGLQHAINAPVRVNKLVLLGPMGLPSWRSTLKLLGPMLSMAIRPTDQKRDDLILRGIGTADRVQREMIDWLRIASACKPRAGWPLKISDANLRRISASTLVLLGEHDGAIGSADAVAHRALRTIPRCEVKVVPQSGHLMMIDQPELVGSWMGKFLEGST